MEENRQTKMIWTNPLKIKDTKYFERTDVESAVIWIIENIYIIFIGSFNEEWYNNWPNKIPNENFILEFKEKSRELLALLYLFYNIIVIIKNIYLIPI